MNHLSQANYSNTDYPCIFTKMELVLRLYCKLLLLFVTKIIDKVNTGNNNVLGQIFCPEVNSMHMVVLKKVIFFLGQSIYSGGSRIFPRGVRQLPNWDYFAIFLPKTA